MELDAAAEGPAADDPATDAGAGTGTISVEDGGVEAAAGVNGAKEDPGSSSGEEEEEEAEGAEQDEEEEEEEQAEHGKAQALGQSGLVVGEDTVEEETVVDRDLEAGEIVDEEL